MTTAAPKRRSRNAGVASLNRNDRLMLLGFTLLFSLLSFGTLSLLLPWLLRFTLAEVLSNDLNRQSTILRKLVNSDIRAANPSEQPLRIWPGPQPPLSSQTVGPRDAPLLLAALAELGERGPLRCQPLEPFRLYCGYWLRVDTTDPLIRTYWVYSAPSRAMPWLWPLIRNLSLLIGSGLSILTFLQWRLQRPLQQILNRLPVIPSNELEAVPECGMAAMRELSVRINRCFEIFNQQRETRRRFLQGLAHDIGSPLTRLSMRLEDVESDADRPEALSRALPQLREDINRLISLTHLLQQSAGHPEEPFRITTNAVDDLCRRVAASYPTCNIQLQLERRIAQLDPVLIERALVNLIDNALSYGREPIRISNGQQGGTLSLLVEDSGSGLASETLLNLPRIHPFDDRGQAQRTGLGLTIVERCCRLHGGRMVLDRSPLGGLLVQLLLPQD
jgi:two-component system osmolarity sensor histidine kinase EnvZ